MSDLIIIVSAYCEMENKFGYIALLSLADWRNRSTWENNHEDPQVTSIYLINLYRIHVSEDSLSLGHSTKM
jgi:hypothetical protein